MAIQRFEEIEGWQMARRLANQIYDIWSRESAPRDFVLRDQMIRAAGSVMHNIAEGFDSGSNPEFVRFLGISGRSCTELQSQLYLALDRKYVNKAEFDRLFSACESTRAKIGAFLQYLRRSSLPENHFREVTGKNGRKVSRQTNRPHNAEVRRKHDD